MSFSWFDDFFRHVWVCFFFRVVDHQMIRFRLGYVRFLLTKTTRVPSLPLCTGVPRTSQTVPRTQRDVWVLWALHYELVMFLLLEYRPLLCDRHWANPQRWPSEWWLVDVKYVSPDSCFCHLPITMFFFCKETCIWHSSISGSFTIRTFMLEFYFFCQ